MPGARSCGAEPLPAADVLLFVAALTLAGAGRRPHWPGAPILALAGLLAAMLVAQLLWPGLVGALGRDGARIAAGEVWRLLTTNVVQSGGLWHGLGMISALLYLGAVAGPDDLGIAAPLILGAAAGQATALLFDPVGAGSSFALLGLAGSLCPAPRARRIGALVVAGLWLALADPHGPALLAGLALGAWRHARP